MCKPSPLRCRRGHRASEWRGQGRPAHLCNLGSCVLSPRLPCPTSGRLQSQNLNARSPHPTASSPQVQPDAAWAGRGACAGGPPAPRCVEKAQVPMRSSAWDPTCPPTPTEGGNDLSLSLLESMDQNSRISPPVSPKYCHVTRLLIYRYTHEIDWKRLLCKNCVKTTGNAGPDTSLQ